MAADETKHDAVVSEWFRRAASRDDTHELIRAFDEAFTALWQRCYCTLGEVTLMAIVERVLQTATKKFPALASLEIDATGLDCEKLRARTDLSFHELSAAIPFLLAEFLCVLGRLTAEILTPALHAELLKQPPVSSRPANTSERSRRDANEDEAR